MTFEEASYYYNNFYTKGVSSCKLSDMFGLDHGAFLKAFKRYGFPIRSNKINSRKYTADFSYFDVIDNDEKAYWLGFISADGYVSNCDNRKKIGIALGISDKNHLEKFNACLNSTYPIKTHKSSGFAKNDYCRIVIESEYMFNSLVKNGVVEHKSSCIKPPINIINEKFYNSYILGYFDGNGSIWCSKKSKYPFYNMSIVSTDDMLVFIHNFLKRNGVINKNILLEKRKDYQIVSNIRYGGNKQVERILDLLYKNVNPTLPLERKYEKYQKCKNRIFE